MPRRDAEPEDAMTPGDLADLEDAQQRAVTLAALLGEAAWPLGSILPLRRRRTAGAGEVIAHESGYVRRGLELTVLGSHPYEAGGPGSSRVIERTYADAESLVNDGWRID